MKKLWYDLAWEDYLKLQNEDKKLLKKANALLKDIERNPYDGTGNPKLLPEICLDSGAAELTFLTALSTG